MRPFGEITTNGRPADARPGVPTAIALTACLAISLAGCGNEAEAPRPTPKLELFAGNAGGPGNADGTGADARFGGPPAPPNSFHVCGFFECPVGGPAGIATDAVGNVYVADTTNSTIRRITPAGVVTTLAGTAGVTGHADGIGPAASFFYPEGVATDALDNVYVADTFNSTIRKITPVGVVTTLAGNPGGGCGHADGIGAAASLCGPSGISTDGSGNLYVADTFNDTIRKVTPAGAVTTLAGAAGVIGHADGVGAAATFALGVPSTSTFVLLPNGLTTDGNGNVYVSDSGNDTIRRITPAGAVTTLAGTTGVVGHADGIGAAASFDWPMGVTADRAGNVYVADTSNSTIRKVTPPGVVTTLAGTALVNGSADGNGAAASFDAPTGVTTTDASGNLYVVDTYNSTIRRVTLVGDVTTLAGATVSRGHADGRGAAARFAFGVTSPIGLTTDGSGNVYVADAENNTIRKITSAGDVTTLAGTAGFVGNADGMGSAASFNNPQGVTTDAAGNVYVADSQNAAIRKITPAGVVTTVAGMAGNFGSADGVGPAARFTVVLGLATDASGNVYAADAGNFAIRKITPAGVVTTLAQGFSAPAGVATDGTGNIYVADTGNNTIRKITPAGVVTTVAGTAGLSGETDGVRSAASFDQPLGVATDRAGNIYVADGGGSTIRKITRDGTVSTVVGKAGVIGFLPGNLPGVLSHPSGLTLFGTTLYITVNNAIVRVTNVP